MLKLQDAKYAIKVLLSARSGYWWLEYNSRSEWQPIGYTMEPIQCCDSVGLYPAFKLENEPYYVCARFGNGRHIPLPLVLGDDEDAGPLQRLALRLASRFSKAFHKAEFDCATYDEQWRDDCSRYALLQDAAQLSDDLQESSDFPASPDFPGRIESDRSEHCSAASGCDECEHEGPQDCPGMDN